MKVLGVDLSTVSIGFCEMDLYEVFGFSIQLKKWKSHKIRRQVIREYLKYFSPDYIIVERVRLFHRSFININVIKRLMGITYLIIDFFDCPVYSIDVRSWKKHILGSAKVEKEESVKYVKKKYNMVVNNDLADAVCLAEIGLRMQEFSEKFKEIE